MEKKDFPSEETLVRQIAGDIANAIEWLIDDAKKSQSDIGKVSEQITNAIKNALNGRDADHIQEILSEIVGKTIESLSKVITTRSEEDIKEKIKNIANDSAVAIIDHFKKNKAREIMPDFIQALYGVVIGVNSLQFIKSVKELDFHASLPDINPTFRAEEIIPISWVGLLFKFLFFGFTVLVVAHDWFVYYKSEKETHKAKHEFWSYVPQLGSLFFLAQMLNAASNNEMVAWFAWGLFYTVCNIWNTKENLEQKEDGRQTVYIIHLSLCIVFIFSLFLGSIFKWLWQVQSGVLFFTILIVVALWHWREVDYKKPTWVRLHTTMKRASKKPFIWVLSIMTILICALTFIVLPNYQQDAHNSIAADSLKVDSLGKRIDLAIRDLKVMDSLSKTELLHQLELLNNQIENFTSNGTEVFPTGLADTSYINTKLAKLNSVLSDLVILYDNQEKLYSTEFSNLNHRFDTTNNGIRDLFAENEGLDDLSKIKFSNEITTLINRIKINLNKLKGKYRRKETIDDMNRLQSKIDSVLR